MHSLKVYILIIISISIFSCKNEKEKDTNIICGYYDKMSYYQGDKVALYLNAKKPISNYKLYLYNINNEIVDSVLIDVFPQEIKDSSFYWKNGFNFKVTGSYQIPENLESGVYHFENSNDFIVKNKHQKNDILILFPSNTNNAYTKSGGRSSYTQPKGDTLSFLRPIETQKYSEAFLPWFLNTEYKADYICDQDLDNYDNLKGYKLLIIIGHSEYWTRKARRNFDKFIAEGGNSLILSGNNMWWHVRYSPDNTQMICFKTTNRIADSLVADSLITVSFIDTHTLKYPIIPSIGAHFRYGGYGNRKDNGWDGYKIVSNSPLFKNTNLKIGDILSLPSAEYDAAPLKFINNKPFIDTTEASFYKIQLLGYDIGVNSKGEEVYGTFIALQKTKTSGKIVNVCSTNWCANEGINGKNSKEVRQITLNAIDILLNNKPLFNDSE
ncbi:MAG: hypothetical protein Kow0079_07280 [Vicingaceae bacterium]